MTLRSRACTGLALAAVAVGAAGAVGVANPLSADAALAQGAPTPAAGALGTTTAAGTAPATGTTTAPGATTPAGETTAVPAPAAGTTATAPPAATDPAPPATTVAAQETTGTATVDASPASDAEAGAVEAVGHAEKKPRGHAPAEEAEAAGPGLPDPVAALLLAPLDAEGVSDAVLGQFRIPPFLLPIYQAAGAQYGIRWEILAAINEIETDYGRTMATSSAGAVGWMQFLPSTWEQYGVDANGDGRRDPDNPADAIFAAARYLRAAGGDAELRPAIFAYNHAGWYVDSVLLRARLIATLPTGLVDALAALGDGRIPVAGEATYDRTGPGDPAVSVHADPGARVVAAQDATVTAVGETADLGRFLRLRDAHGTTYTYAHLGTVAESFPLPKPVTLTTADVRRELELPAPDPRPTAPASAGTKEPGTEDAGASPAADASPASLSPTTIGEDVATPRGFRATPSDELRPALSFRAQARAARTARAQVAQASKLLVPSTAPLRRALPKGARLGPAVAAKPAATSLLRGNAETARANGVAVATPPEPRPTRLRANAPRAPRAVEPVAGEATTVTAPRRLYAHPRRTAAEAPAPADPARFTDYERTLLGVDSDDVDWHALRKGATVVAGTVLGRVGDAGALTFAIRAAGEDGPPIDAKPVLDNWRLAAAARRDDGTGPVAGEVLLQSKADLQARVLSDPAIHLYDCGRRDVRAGTIDRRVLATLAFLSVSGLHPTVSSLRCGHSDLTTSGNISEHAAGAAVDIAAINGVPIAGHQGAGSITDLTIRRLLALQGASKPHQIISLMRFPGADNTLALPDHDDHIHVGFGSLTGQPEAAEAPVVLKPEQWAKLLERLERLGSPAVAALPSRHAIPAEKLAGGDAAREDDAAPGETPAPPSGDAAP